MKNDYLLQIKGLRIHFFTEEGVVQAVDGVDLQIKHQEVLGLVGESGCGKTVTAKSILRLVPCPPGKIIAGEIVFQGQDLLRLPLEILRQEIRGKKISMIFQDPMTSLNPVFTVGNQVSEVFTTHEKLSRTSALKKSINILEQVGIPFAERMVTEYPHRYSGGMRQRAMIAMALGCHPSLLIADEPTTALDVTIQAQILELMRKLKEEFHTSILLITHNLGVVAEMADRVAVMYAGHLMEICPAEVFFDSPAHPYAQGLLHSFPGLTIKREKLNPIPGNIPNMIKPPAGCRFHPRCARYLDRCSELLPPLYQIAPGHEVRCWLYA